MNQRLAGKIALVTGASSGIGEAIAKRFLEEGATVVGCGRRRESSFAAEGYHYLSVDVSSFEDAEKALRRVGEFVDRLDILVNSAGMTGEGSLETTAAEDFNRMFQVNVGGIFNVCKAALPLLRRGEGASIINIASDLGQRPIPDRIAYCPSKAAVIMLTRCMAVELAPAIRANCILPGLVETPMIQHRFQAAADPAAFRAAMANLYPLKRIGEVADMASAAVYLAGPESSFMTGAELPICGGRQM